MNILMYYKIKKYAKALRTFLGVIRPLRDKLQVSVKYITGAPRIQLVFRDISLAQLSRKQFYQLFSVAYHERLFPVSCVKGKINLSNGLYADPDVDDLYVSLLVSSGWEDLGDKVSKNGITFYKDFGLPSIYEIFEESIYDLNVMGREVADIGASVADSAIYFASKGAKHVFAYEPVPSRYKLALSNIELNKQYANMNSIFNVAVDVRDGVKRMVDDSDQRGDTFEVQSISLANVINRMEDPYLLKLDCEGCEYPLILSAYESISRFENVILEYHPNIVGRGMKLLLAVLEKDFTCRVTHEDSLIGILSCKRTRCYKTEKILSGREKS